MSKSQTRQTKLFVVGVGRSGTSLLQAMLASHSEIEFLPETSFLRRWVGESDGSLEAGQLQSQVQHDERVARLNINFDDFDFDSLSDNWPELDLYESFFRQINNSKFVGDKDPRLIEFVSFVTSRWKNCKVIHIYRDPRDVLASKKKADWSKKRSLMFHMIAGAAQYRLGNDQRLSDQVLKVKYEKLTSEPEQTLQSICRWLDVPFESAMLRFGDKARSLTAESETQWKKETFGPLLKDNSGKWQSELTSFEIVATEVANSELMIDGSYHSYRQLEVKKPNLITKLAASVAGIIAKTAAAIYCIRRTRKNKKLMGRLGKC